MLPRWLTGRDSRFCAAGTTRPPWRRGSGSGWLPLPRWSWPTSSPAGSVSPGARTVAGSVDGVFTGRLVGGLLP